MTEVGECDDEGGHQLRGVALKHVNGVVDVFYQNLALDDVAIIAVFSNKRRKLFWRIILRWIRIYLIVV